MEKQSKEFMENHVAHFMSDLQEIDEEQSRSDGYDCDIQEKLDEVVYRMVNECRLFETKHSLPDDEISDVKSKFRSLIDPWYSQSFLTHRGLTKPKGYPGDYVALEGIYNGVPLSKGIGLYLDIFFLNAQLAKAIQNRKNFVRNVLDEELSKRSNGFKAVNIASGSCREWYELIQTKDTSGVELTCIDFDQESLDFSSQRLEDMDSGIIIEPLKENIIKFALRKDNVERMGEQDFVYSIGLYDYIPDKILRRVLSAQYELLKDDGRMLVAFKDVTRYDKTLYDWIADWSFVPRTKEEIDCFLAEMGFDFGKIDTAWEPLNTIVFYNIKK